MRWFGRTWGAPANHPDYEIPIPMGDTCEYCGVPFDADSQGYAIPRAHEEVDDYYHLNCWLVLTVGPGMADFIERTRSGEAGQDQQEAGQPRAIGGEGR